jgi:hypothetical protein
MDYWPVVPGMVILYLCEGRKSGGENRASESVLASSSSDGVVEQRLMVVRPRATAGAPCSQCTQMDS